MRRTKCTIFRKLSIILSFLFALAYSVLSFSNVLAVAVQLYSFSLHYSLQGQYNCPSPNSNWVWQSNMHYDDKVDVCSIVNFQVHTYDVSSTGNYWSARGKINLVVNTGLSGASPATNAKKWSNLGYIEVIQAKMADSVLNISDYSINTFDTLWVGNNNGSNSANLPTIWYRTLTIEFQAEGTGSSGKNGEMVFMIGSNDYAKPIWDNYSTSSSVALRTRTYFEDTGEPWNINFSSNAIDDLQGTIVNQNQTMIYQNDTIIQQNNREYQQDQQDRSDLQNTSNTANSDASSSATSVTNTSSSLLTIIGNFINIVLHPPASNCVIDGDLGNMDLGDIDLCQLSVPPALSVLATVLLIGVLIPFVISLVSTFLNLLKGATQ